MTICLHLREHLYLFSLVVLFPYPLLFVVVCCCFVWEFSLPVSAVNLLTPYRYPGDFSLPSYGDIQVLVVGIYLGNTRFQFCR